jgi:uncharacterized repeat protein (TIGR03803 family)
MAARPNAGLPSALFIATVAVGVIVAPIGLGSQVSIQVMHALNGADGAHPFYSGLLQADDGQFYGTTFLGGAFECLNGECGTVYQITADGILTVLYQFTGGTDGNFPVSSLIQGTDGAFYGITSSGGDFDFGTVYRIGADGTFSVVHAFQGGADGGSSLAPLLLGVDGNFYGTGRAGGRGTVFQLTPDGTLNTLHVFTGADGANPGAGLVQGSDGNFYGSTADGGGIGCEDFGGCGTIFQIRPDGTFTLLHAFAGGADGARPRSALLEATDGNFYGTTSEGGGGPCGDGTSGCGTVFQLSPDGTVTVLYAFQNSTDGRYPFAGLIQAADGNLYGTTTIGGCSPFCSGTIFQVTLDGTFTSLYAFADSTYGANPYATLIQATDGNLYGTTYYGGDLEACSLSGCGTIFRLLSAAPSGHSIPMRAHRRRATMWHF